MKTIVFIETNKSGSSREAIQAAERLGFFTVLLTNKRRFIDQRTEFPDVHQMIVVEIFDYDQLRKKITKLIKQGKQIKGILSFIDPFVHVAASLSEEFCPGVVSAVPIKKMEDKVLTREILKDLPITPRYAIYSPNQSLEGFINKINKKFLPLIVKSPLSSGSKDVLLANDEYQLKHSMQFLLGKYEKYPVLLEEFLTGPQYLIEALVHNGNVHIVAIIEQEITFFQRFIVTGYCLLADPDRDFYNKLYETVSSVLQAFEMKNGACHLEMRLVQGEWKLIEINPRISGGAMNQIIEAAYGINLVEETIQLFLGNKPRLIKKHNKYAYAHYLTINSKGKLLKVTGKKRCSQYPGVEKVYIKPRKGQILRPPLSMGDRCGYILTSSDDKEEAKRIAMEAKRELRFFLEDLE
ncbi:ATP-grasp domain-containing protein [Cytobacillus praedii]|uniref:ATP-grasp domain-containing protein n=1 Tax=Cytobacillus praedii TaxID=1742358 RepID=UPI002E2076DC|nr:ATP-grasp domain-containing protein [Cytobacillus praedii]